MEEECQCVFQQRIYTRNAASISTLLLSGLLGVLLKHGVEAAFISQLEAPFREFPANMVGCFLLGFFTRISSPAAAVVGSATSFAPWIHALASAFLAGKWLFALCSLVTGLELCYMSFRVGLDAAEMLRLPQLLSEEKQNHHNSSSSRLGIFSWLLVVLLAAFDCGSTSRRQLWLACAVAPQGVWLRHLASKLNSHSLPLGTGLSNLIATALQAGLLIIKSPDPASGIAIDAFQRGFVDSTGTISTVVAEAHAIQSSSSEEKSCWRAYLYVISTMATCLLAACIIISATGSSTSSSSSSTLLPPDLIQALSS